MSDPDPYGTFTTSIADVVRTAMDNRGSMNDVEANVVFLIADLMLTIDPDLFEPAFKAELWEALTPKELILSDLASLIAETLRTDL